MPPPPGAECGYCYGGFDSFEWQECHKTNHNPPAIYHAECCPECIEWHRKCGVKSMYGPPRTPIVQPISWDVNP